MQVEFPMKLAGFCISHPEAERIGIKIGNLFYYPARCEELMDLVFNSASPVSPSFQQTEGHRSIPGSLREEHYQDYKV